MVGLVGAGVAGFYGLKLAILGINKVLKIGTFLTKAYGAAKRGIPFAWAIGKEIAHKGAIVAKTKH